MLPVARALRRASKVISLPDEGAGPGLISSGSLPDRTFDKLAGCVCGMLMPQQISTMDALADYGSDDDSSTNKEETTENQSEVKPSSLSGLLGAYSDPSSSDSDGDDGSAVAAQTRPAIRQETGRESDSPQTKKLRVSPKTCDQKEEVSLLPPQLGSSSIILWEEDFVSKPRQHASVCERLSTPPQLADKLQKLSATTSTTSWADHLKAQREFHNPHFFKSVVKHFGIQRALGNHINNCATKDYDLDALGLSQKSTDME